MSATVNFKYNQKANVGTKVFRTINGIKYIHFQFAKFKHDNNIKVNGVTYYQLQD